VSSYPPDNREASRPLRSHPGSPSPLSPAGRSFGPL